MNGDLPLFNLPEIEREILKFWKEKKVFKEGMKRSEKTAKKNFVFFEGPPTANGHPGLHHVLARVYKDVILRYRTMKGEYVLRRAGWDTQGLPVEIQVEKELGLKDKNDIETYGVAAFNQKAKDSVWQFKGEWENLTERIGYWLDFENDYVTYRNDYLESIWWILGQAHGKKLIKKSYRIAPWCTRCGTTCHLMKWGSRGFIN